MIKINPSGTYTDEEIRANRLAWITALESGKYKQGHGTLHSADGFCCLGVVCDILTKSGELSRSVYNSTRYMYKTKLAEFLRTSLNLRILDALHMDLFQQSACINMNDALAFDFEMIAKELRAKWNLPK